MVREAALATTTFVVGDHALTTAAVRLIIKRTARRAVDEHLVNLPGKELDTVIAALSTHSLRVGLTQDLFATGEDAGADRAGSALDVDLNRVTLWAQARAVIQRDRSHVTRGERVVAVHGGNPYRSISRQNRTQYRGIMQKRLFSITERSEQIDWVIARLRAGGSINDVSLWIDGVDEPKKFVADVESQLRADGLRLGSEMRQVCDAVGGIHPAQFWSIEDQAIAN